MLGVFGQSEPGAHRPLRPHLHGAAARRALPGRRRGPRAAGASTCPAEDLARFGCGRGGARAARTPPPPLRAVLAFEVERARGLLARRACPCSGTLRGRAAARRRRVRGRRPRRARRDRARRLRRARGAARRRRRAAALAALAATLAVPEARAGERRDRVRGGLRPLRGDHARAGRELLLRHPAALAASAAGRCAPSTRSRGASTTSATAISPAERKLALLTSQERGARRAGAGRARSPGGDPVMVGAGRRAHPLRAAAGRARRADRGRADGRARVPRYRDLRGARALLPPRRRRRSGGCAWRSSACARALAATLAAPACSPMTSASRCSSRTSCATSARTPRTGASTSRAEDLRRLRSARSGPGRAARGASAPPPAATRSGGGVRARWSRFEAARAREWFDRGMELAPLLDRRSAACVLAMAGIYRRLLERIDADPAAVLTGRVSLPARREGAGSRCAACSGAGA